MLAQTFKSVDWALRRVGPSAGLFVFDGAPLGLHPAGSIPNARAALRPEGDIFAFERPWDGKRTFVPSIFIFLTV